MPPALRAAIDAELDGLPAPALAAASAALSDTYATGGQTTRADALGHAAYLAVRMPATYAAVRAALARVPSRALAAVRTALDLGSGPGTASWAALDACDGLQHVAQVDRSAALLDVGRRLWAAAGASSRVGLAQHASDVAGVALPNVDLAVAAYVLAELSQPLRAATVTRLWQAAGRMLVIVEPGTPAGFARVHDARATLLDAGAHIVAPCPGAVPCPMFAAGHDGDWCHFAVRVPRTRRHRRIKGGSLGYEDEKFAYLVMTRDADDAPAPSRILRHPRVEPGRIALTLCTTHGVERRLVTRRDEAWRAARKAEWGDAAG